MEKEKVIVLTATYENFDEKGGSMIMWNADAKVDAWKLAFYELWRYQMTWQPCYRLEVIDGKDALFVRAVCKEGYLEPMISTMEGVGYREIKQYETNVGFIDCLKVPDDVEELEIGW